jgi:uncharacterized membrane protein YqhA
VVLLAVVAVLLVSVALFLLGTGLALVRVWDLGGEVLRGQFDSTETMIDLLEIVSIMLKAVIFYIIGVGFYSLFITPLNVTAALGVETFTDLEAKVISVIVVIMAVTFLEHFILWQNAQEVLYFGLALALVIGVLSAFQLVGHRTREGQARSEFQAQVRAQKHLFEEDQEKQDVRDRELEAGLTDGTGVSSAGERPAPG